MSLPKRLIVEYENGSTKGIDFNQLSRRSWLELSKLGLCSPPSTALRRSQSYLVLRWQDGWQEVLGIDESHVELLRYYVLERLDDIGRMALEITGDYPALLIIRRKPKELNSLIIVGSGDAVAYGLEPKARREDGGKIEHVEYDKAERHFQHESGTNVGAGIEEISGTLKTALDKKNLTAESLLAMEPIQRIEEYRGLARTLGIMAAEKQEDVYGFIQLLAENMASVSL